MWISLARTALAAPFNFSFPAPFPIMTVSKDFLRREALAHRAQIDRSVEDPQSACALFFEAIAPSPHDIVGGYWPKDSEFSPLDILDALLRRGNVCALPIIRSGQDRTLDFAVWNESIPLEKGAFGIHEPCREAVTAFVDPDILLVPLLAFDRKGHRLGYGRGYYDTTLKALREKKRVLAVGIAYGAQAVLFNLPHEPHDVPLDWVVTPQKAHRF